MHMGVDTKDVRQGHRIGMIGLGASHAVAFAVACVFQVFHHRHADSETGRLAGADQQGRRHPAGSSHTK